VGLASRFRAPLSIAYRYCELRLRMTAISDGLEAAANRPWRKRRSAPFVRSGRDQSTDDPFGSPLPPLSGQTNRTWCKCRGVAANDLPRVTGSSEQKSSTNFAPEAHMRIRFGIRPEAPNVSLNERKELSARTWHSSLLLRLLLRPRPLRTRDASCLHSVRRGS
jgi:hypothetical protein